MLGALRPRLGRGERLGEEPRDDRGQGPGGGRADEMSVARCDQVRAIDVRRITKVKGTADPADLAMVRRIVATLIGM